jgi:polyisoprenoid-binding protein YceI
MNTRRLRIAAFVSAASLAALAPAALLLLTAPNPAHAQKAASREEMATGTWAVDKTHTDIGFTVTHLGVSKVRGSFGEFDGEVVADGKSPAKSSVSFTIQTASINTNNAKRDEHLKSPEIFDAARYPTIAFKSTSVRKSGNGFVARGPLTLHGVTKVVELPFTVSGPAKGPGGLHMGVETALKISRKEYGLTWGPVIEGTAVVSDEVAIDINLELVKKGAQQASSR